MKTLLLEIRSALAATLVFAVVLCFLYPVSVWLGGRLLFPREAAGSLIKDSKGTIVGSALIAQTFTAAKYFHSRPSAAGAGNDAASSSGSNLGPTSAKLSEDLKGAIASFRAENHLLSDHPVPADAVTRSGSGLDPHISVSNALLQAPRVAAERRMSEASVREFIDRFTTPPDLRIFGEPRVNVLLLNLALNESAPVH